MVAACAVNIAFSRLVKKPFIRCASRNLNLVMIDIPNTHEMAVSSVYQIRETPYTSNISCQTIAARQAGSWNLQRYVLAIYIYNFVVQSWNKRTLVELDVREISKCLLDKQVFLSAIRHFWTCRMLIQFFHRVIWQPTLVRFVLLSLMFLIIRLLYAPKFRKIYNRQNLRMLVFL